MADRDGTADRQEALQRIAELAAKVRLYAATDPEVALGLVRKTAEAILRHVFAEQVGEPGKIMLDQLMQKLGGAGHLPPHVLVPLGTIRDYGNFGVHAQSGPHRIDRNYVAPAISALERVLAWLRDEYLAGDAAGQAVLTGHDAASPPTSATSAASGPRWPLLAAAAVAVAALGWMASGRFGPPGAEGQKGGTPGALTEAAAPAPASTQAPQVALAEQSTAAALIAGDDALRLELAVHAAEGGGAPRVLRAGEALRSGARVFFQVRVSRPAHVYLAQRSQATGRAAALFPNPRIAVTNPVPGGQWVRIPARGEFEVDDRDLGTERVFALAALRPIVDLERAVAGRPPATAPAQRAPSIDEALATASLLDVPGCAGARSLRLAEDGDCGVRPRGLVLPDEAPAGAARAASTRVQARPGDAMVVAPFSFQHVAAGARAAPGP